MGHAFRPPHVLASSFTKPVSNYFGQACRFATGFPPEPLERASSSAGSDAFVQGSRPEPLAGNLRKAQVRTMKTKQLWKSCCRAMALLLLPALGQGRRCSGAVTASPRRELMPCGPQKA